MAKKLTERQSEILDYITSYISRNNTSPTISELARAFDISEPGAWYHIKALEKKDIVRVRTNVSRGISLVSWDEYKPGTVLIRQYSETDFLQGRKSRYTTFNASALSIQKDRDYFCIKMESSNLINAGIHKGDELIFEKTSVPVNHSIVIESIEGADQLELRTYNEQGGKIILQAECDSIGNISCQSCTIHAVLHALVRIYGRN